jgi:hypothetical protein
VADRRRDGSKLSFAERDKRRREGGGERDRGPRGPGTAGGHAQKSYRAALERAFESGRVEEFAATVMRARNPLSEEPDRRQAAGAGSPDAPAPRDPDGTAPSKDGDAPTGPDESRP